MRKIIATAFAGIITVLSLLLAPTTQAAPQLGDCKRVAVADQPLCLTVKAQAAYAFATASGFHYRPNGKAVVREITHQGNTKREMHSALVQEAASYAAHYTRARAVVVDMGSVLKHHGSDAQVIVGFRDADGKPGGVKRDRVQLDLP